jgi:hypothetical protein
VRLTASAAVTAPRSLALVVLGVLLALAGLTALYVKRELADPDAFADRAVTALRSEQVRGVIAEQVAVEMLERGAPDLVASRPLLLAAVEAVLETDEFEPVLRRSAVTAHEVLLRGDSDVVVELEAARAVLLPAVRSAAPEVARRIPEDLSPTIAQVRATDAATTAVRVADDASDAALPLLLAALLAFALAIAPAPDRPRALAVTGGGLLAGGAAGLVAMAALRAQAISEAGRVGVLSEDDARAAAGATWDALAGGLESWLLIMAVCGLAMVAGVLLGEARVDRAAALRHAAEIVAGGRLPRLARVLRGLALAALGALILLGTEPVLAAAVIVLGGALVVLGLAEALSTVARPSRPARRAGGSRGRPRRIAVAAGVASVAVAVAATLALRDRGRPAAPPPMGEIVACNGLPELCDRRLDDVVLAGTHNSMSAADRAGWLFANQVRPIPRQLDDGIRLLMLDPHYGVIDSRGRVRTDLQAEGTTRNRVARRLGAEAVGVAERLVGRLGLVPSEGERRIFLCHTLCELGAERMSSTLNEIRGFLERNRSEVLVVLLESSVDPAEVERAFDDADLEPYLATLRRAAPLPTLREMIASGRRLVVLDERDGGDAPWYQPAALFVQDTRIGSLLDSPTDCQPNRGTPDSPLLVMNHWIDRFPPPLTENRAISTRGALLERVRSCRRSLGRVPTAIAGDFYDRGAIIATVGELNTRGPGG